MRDGAAILAFLMPVFVDVMMDNPGEDCGAVPSTRSCNRVLLRRARCPVSVRERAAGRGGGMESRRVGAC